MKRWYWRLVTAAASILALLPVAAEATLITYQFSVVATTGPLSGTSASGTFSYDSSIVPAVLPAQLKATGLLADLDFTWDGIAYNAGTANTGELDFDAAGNLTLAFFGTNCGAGTCQAGGGEVWSFSSLGFFFYSIAGVAGFFGGVATLGPRVTAPEPGTLALIAAALFAMAFLRRWRHHSDRRTRS